MHFLRAAFRPLLLLLALACAHWVGKDHAGKGKGEEVTRPHETGRNAQLDATAAIREMAAAQTESNEITRTLMTEMGLRPPPRKKK